MKKIFLYLIKKLNILIIGLSMSLSANYSIAHEIEVTPQEQAEYIEDYLEFFDFHVRKMEDFDNKNRIGISLSVKNLGTRTIERIEIIVFFLDHHGNAFFEEDYAIVQAGFDGSLLKPNYTSRMYPKSYFPLDGRLLGDEWSGKAMYEIKEVTFSD